MLYNYIWYFLRFEYKKSSAPASYEQKIAEWEKRGSGATSEVVNGIIWTKRNMTMISDKGKVQEIQVGLHPNGTFVWKPAADSQLKEFQYK